VFAQVEVRDCVQRLNDISYEVLHHSQYLFTVRQNVTWPSNGEINCAMFPFEHPGGAFTGCPGGVLRVQIADQQGA